METQNANNMDIKKINRANTMRCIFAHEQISQPELVQKLLLSWPTILSNVRELVAMGLVKEAGTSKSTGGRKAKVFAPVPDARAVIGLDITQNHIGLVTVDLSGKLLDYTRERKPFSMSEDYFDFINTGVRNFVQKSGFPDEKILGIGISLPGIVNEKEHYMYSHVLGLQKISTEILEHHMPYPCRLVNDANAAGYAEIRGNNNLEATVYLSLSNSVGGAVLTPDLPEHIVKGIHLRAGEFGHMTLVPDGRQCYCGKYGCVDAYCSAKVLSSQAGDNLDAFFDGLREGNPKFQDVWETYLDHLAVAINNIHVMLDCNVVIGGYVGSFMEEYADGLKARLAQRNTFGNDTSYLKICQYRREAAAAGAAFLIIEQFINEME